MTRNLAVVVAVACAALVGLAAAQPRPMGGKSAFWSPFIAPLVLLAQQRLPDVRLGACNGGARASSGDVADIKYENVEPEPEPEPKPEPASPIESTSEPSERIEPTDRGNSPAAGADDDACVICARVPKHEPVWLCHCRKDATRDVICSVCWTTMVNGASPRCPLCRHEIVELSAAEAAELAEHEPHLEEPYLEDDYDLVSSEDSSASFSEYMPPASVSSFSAVPTVLTRGQAAAFARFACPAVHAGAGDESRRADGHPPASSPSSAPPAQASSSPLPPSGSAVFASSSSSAGGSDDGDDGDRDRRRHRKTCGGPGHADAHTTNDPSAEEDVEDEEDGGRPESSAAAQVSKKTAHPLDGTAVSLERGENGELLSVLFTRSDRVVARLAPSAIRNVELPGRSTTTYRRYRRAHRRVRLTVNGCNIVAYVISVDVYTVVRALSRADERTNDEEQPDGDIVEGGSPGSAVQPSSSSSAGTDRVRSSKRHRESAGDSGPPASSSSAASSSALGATRMDAVDGQPCSTPASGKSSHKARKKGPHEVAPASAAMPLSAPSSPLGAGLLGDNIIVLDDDDDDDNDDGLALRFGDALVQAARRYLRVEVLLRGREVEVAAAGDYVAGLLEYVHPNFAMQALHAVARKEYPEEIDAGGRKNGRRFRRKRPSGNHGGGCRATRFGDRGPNDDGDRDPPRSEVR